MTKVTRQDLLIELGTEELPPASLKALGKEFANNLGSQLSQADLIEDLELKWFATPRRLAVLIPKVARNGKNRIEERRGPSVNHAFDKDNQPTKATKGFAKSCGVSVDKLDRLITNKGEWLVYKREVPGQNISDAIESYIKFAIQNLPIAKRMRWGDGSYEFVRPIHWLVVIHGSKVIPYHVRV